MKGLDAKGQPIPDPAKEPKVDGSLVDMPAGGGTNWPPPSFDPQTGLFYVNGKQGYGMAYLYDTSDHPEGYCRRRRRELSIRAARFSPWTSAPAAIRWKHEHGAEGRRRIERRRAHHRGQTAVHGRFRETWWRSTPPTENRSGISACCCPSATARHIHAGRAPVHHCAAGDTIYALRLAGPPPAAAAKLP